MGDEHLDQELRPVPRLGFLVDPPDVAMHRMHGYAQNRADLRLAGAVEDPSAGPATPPSDSL